MVRLSLWTPDPTRGPAFRAIAFCTAIVLAIGASSCAGRRDTSEERLTREWIGVQAQFERLEKFELDFRVAAADASAKPDTEKLRFVRDALDRRSDLQIGLKRELQRFTKAAAREPRSARTPYIIKVNVAMDKLRTVENESLPAIRALGLRKYETELSAYQAQRDAALQTAK